MNSNELLIHTAKCQECQALQIKFDFGLMTMEEVATKQCLCAEEWKQIRAEAVADNEVYDKEESMEAYGDRLQDWH